MRILLVSGSLPPMPCGVGDYTDALANALVSQPGNAVAVLTSTAASVETTGLEDGYTRFATIRDWTFRDIRTAWRVLRAWKPDVVHLQYPTQGYRSKVLPSFVPLMAWLAGARPVRTWHEAFSGRQSLPLILQSAAPGPCVVVRPNFLELMWRPLRPLLRWRRRTMITGASSIPRSTIDAEEKAALRDRYRGGQERLIVFFGFVYPAKGVDQLFDVADPVRDAIVVAGELDASPTYAAVIRGLATSGRWAGRVTLTGFLPVAKIADLLAAADAVVLPFVDGGGSWNSSISAATIQGTPVVTTSRERHGLDDDGQVYFAKPSDIADLRLGLDSVRRRSFPNDGHPSSDDWVRIRDAHMAVYDLARPPLGLETGL